jgi:hypothetical protein
MGKRATRPASDEWRKSPGQKDTKRWCGGHVGREHERQIVLAERWAFGKTCGPTAEVYPWGSWRKEPWVCFHEERCARCGKHLRTISWKDCPDRVDTPA